MNFFWFGDSWIYGDELDCLTGVANWQDFTFASIVSKYFQAQCVNLGECASSLDDLAYRFYHTSSMISPGDIVFFGITANHRVSFFDDQKVLRRVTPQVMYSKHRPHPNREQWYKWFDSPYQRLYNQDRTINLLYLWCEKIGVRCFFMNLFTIQQEPSVIDITPSTVWLISRDDCLAARILPMVGTDEIFLDDQPSLTNEQWLSQKSCVEKYIRPNWTHPNVEGHNKIAEFLIEQIEIQT